MNPDWICPDWPAPRTVRALVTTRGDGVSKGPWSGFNLGAHCGDDPLHVQENRAALDAVLPSPVRWLHQVHGSTVRNVTGVVTEETEGDAMVAFEPDRVCAVLTADCLPAIFCNRRGDRVGIAHAGWRGLAGGVLEAVIDAMETGPEELMVWLGPAIGPGAYEVGTDVADAFTREFPAGFTARGDRYLLDLYQLARLKLSAAGVRSVYGGGFCTMTDSTRFYSFRRDGVTGRMASLVWFEKIAAKD